MNNNFGISDRSYRLIISLFRRFPEIEKAIIFGSRAMGNFKQGSDIDIALAGKNITSKLISTISAELNEELPVPYHIDLVDMNTITNKELIDHILKYGVEFYYKKTVSF